MYFSMFANLKGFMKRKGQKKLSSQVLLFPLVNVIESNTKSKVTRAYQTLN